MCSQTKSPPHTSGGASPSGHFSCPDSCGNCSDPTLRFLQCSGDPASGSRHQPFVADPHSSSSPTRSSSSSDSHALPQAVGSVSQEKVTAYVLWEALSEIVEHLASTAELLGINLLPKSWDQVLQVLVKLGYRSPRHYKVCCEKEHSVPLKDRQTTPSCYLCGKVWSQCIDYYVVGMNFQDWFLTDQQCLSHWEDRPTWLNQPSSCGHTEKCELWHGERWRELCTF